ncbi:conserved exported hypothetical protein [Candidatus Terasakiella magnetica]|nr:conserved exported hypothetical protein [Candidatus Terasakiella magnetica]
MKEVLAAAALMGVLAWPVLAASPPKIDVKSYGPSFPVMSEPVATPSGEMSETVKQSIGCVVGGTVGTAAALSAGAENLVNVIAGGLVTPANPFVLYSSLMGVVFASFCAVGQAVTPLVLYYTDPPPVLPPPLPSPQTRMKPVAVVAEVSSFRRQLRVWVDDVK